MKILVCIAKTPDTTARIGFKDGDTQFDDSGVTMIMNPYDEWYALVRALELVESVGGDVTVIHVGSSDGDAIIRKALAIGAERAVRIDADARDADFVAHQIAHYAQSQSFDAIFVGKETIDYNGNEVGAMIAELLDYPFISYASHLDTVGSSYQITRDIEGGVEVVSVEGPFVLSAAKGLAEQRIPNMKGIMMAKRKPLDVVAAVPVNQLTEVVHFSLPQSNSSVKMIDPEQMDELVRLLHEEAKVI